MKLILILLCFLAFAGCGQVPANEPVSTSTTASTVSEADDTPLILLHTSEGDVEPYRHFRSASEWTENGWVVGCGASVYSSLPTICDKLPTVTYSKDFGVSYGENVSFYQLEIYDEAFQRIDGTELAVLDAGTYYISIEVTRQGDYIPSEKDYNTYGSAGVFRMMMP